MTGLYIHIPFCESRCVYCGFYSTTRRELQDDYVRALCREMAMRKDEGADGLATVYIGGGTPSQLSASNIRRIFDGIDDVFSPDWGKMEITMECNPEDITDDFCRALSQTPVNRVSMGAQTFSDVRLRFLRRRHDAAQVDRAVRRLRAVGIDNISIDLMFGFPGETVAEWTDDISCALALRPEHLSAYSLQYDEDTPLYRMLAKGEVSEIDDETYRMMYNVLCDRMEAAGYDHYEISNFALPGRRSRHNSSYWHDVPYIGLGASAHSHSGKQRSWNVSSMTEYIRLIMSGVRPSESETIDERTHYDDMVMTALRTREGINLDEMPVEFRRYIVGSAEKYNGAGEMWTDGHRLALTREGIFVSDMIMADLMRPDE